jgi:diadenosine tetraphosphate (Ap4A) HIT family hydrolase
MGHAIEDTIEIQLLLCMDAGSVFEDDGIRYYMNSREAGKHNEPHVHVDIRHETSGSFSIITGKKLSKGKIKTSDVRKIQMMIANHQAELINFWNEHTDGLTVDLDQAFGLIGY